MRKQSSQQQRRRANPVSAPPIAHTIPTWQAKPGANVQALCGEWVHVPDGPVVRDALDTNPDCVICPLCEAAALLDGIPSPPQPGSWVQGALWTD